MKAPHLFLLWSIALAGAYPRGAANGIRSRSTNFRTPLYAEPSLSDRSLLLPDGKYLLFANPDTLGGYSPGM